MGKQVRNILEQSVENTLTDDPKTKVEGMNRVSGLTFSFDPKRRFEIEPKGYWFPEVKPILQETYRILTNALLVEGGHRYTTFLSRPNSQSLRIFFRS